MSSPGEKSTSAVNYEKNVKILSAGFFGVFIAFNTSQALETTIVSNEGLAHTSLAVLYGAFTAMAIVSPRIVDVLGPRVSMIVGAVPYILICLANIKPSYALTVPAFALVGLGAALLWTGQGVYLGRCAVQHARQFGEHEDVVTSRFNGAFFAAFQFNGFLGSLIAAIAFSGGGSFNTTAKYLYIGLACAAGVGTFILTLTDSMPPVVAPPSKSVESESGRLLQAEDKPEPVSLYETLRLSLTSPRMMLAIPIILYNGMSLGFFFSDYPVFYADVDADKKKHIHAITRLMSKKRVGYVVATFYLFNSIASFLWGRVASRIGRRGCMFIATVLHIIFFSLVLILDKTSIHKTLGHENIKGYLATFLLAICFAIGDAVWESQPPAVLQSSTFFPVERDRDAAMSNLKMWQSLGFAIQFAFGIVIKTYWIKLTILLVLQVIAGLCLLYLNFRVQGLDADSPAKGTASSAALHVIPPDEDFRSTAHQGLLVNGHADDDLEAK